MSDVVESPLGRSVVCRAGSRLVAVPVASAVETMRALPVAPLPSAPRFVLGAAIVRGVPTPVVDVAALLGEDGATARRFVTVRGAARPVALAVDETIGVWDLTGAPTLDLRTAIGEAGDGPLGGLGARGSDLLVVLRTARLVPDEVWSTLEERR